MEFVSIRTLLEVLNANNKWKFIKKKKNAILKLLCLVFCTVKVLFLFHVRRNWLSSKLLPISYCNSMWLVQEMRYCFVASWSSWVFFPMTSFISEFDTNEKLEFNYISYTPVYFPSRHLRLSVGSLFVL